MTKSPVPWGIGLTFALGGAIAGNAVGSTPLSDRSTVAMYYQSHETAFADRQDQRVLPNHYPLVTRSGVVEVAQLSDRGLFSQARYRAAHLASADINDTGAGFGIEDNYESPIQAVTPEVAAPAETLALAQSPSDALGQAKIIDVQATLAMR